jgi:SAM-dependent methyltransferase
MATQEAIHEEALAAGVDPALSWSEADLPERERTKHVHRLHPYLGKYVPQLVETFLQRHFEPGQRVLDPFAGSGTTLVECSTFGCHSVGVDVSAFNVLLASAKVRERDPERTAADLRDALARFEAGETAGERSADPYLEEWFAPRALGELMAFRALADDYPESADLLRVILCRAARSARLTTHFDLDFPRLPQREPYSCRKHRRTCQPTDEAAKFLRRYTADTARRVAAYQALRQPVDTVVRHGDARTLDHGVALDGIVTSPPYPGRIDYHGQHRYAFALLGLPTRLEEEIGAPARGLSRRAIATYVDDVAAVLANARRHLRPGAAVVIVIDDSRSLYDDVLARAGLELVERSLRHVNRRTGLRAGQFYEQILLARS